MTMRGIFVYSTLENNSRARPADLVDLALSDLAHIRELKMSII